MEIQDCREYLLGVVRLQIALAKMEGVELDKKATRYNDMVDSAIMWASFGESFSSEKAEYFLRKETIGFCIVGDTMHTGEPFDFDNYRWMLVCLKSICT